MANAATAEDHVTLNLGEGGAVIATDFVSSANYGDGANDVHFQVVKLSTGGAGEYALLSTSAPAPVQVWKIGNTDVSEGFVAVRGNTMGTAAVPVSLSGATLEVNNIIISGIGSEGEFGISSDIRSVAQGVTFGVVGVDGTTAVAVTGDVRVGSGISADIRSLPLPTGMTSFSVTVGDNQLRTFGAYSLSSGVKIKNYYSGIEGFTPGEEKSGGGILCIGATGQLAAGKSSGYLLAPGEEVFLEIDNTNNIVATSVDFGGDGLSDYCIISILGT